MIISHKYKFIFIKTRKTASTSIEIILSKYCDKKDIITPIAGERKYRAPIGVYPRNFRLPFYKFTKNEILQRIKNKNPQDKKYGCLRYYNHISATEIHRFINKKIWNNYFKFCFERNSFDKVISWYFMKNTNGEYSDIDDYLENDPPLSDFSLYTMNNELAVDFVGQYHHLREDLTTICEKLGIPWDGQMPNAKGSFRKDKSQPAEILNETQVKKIASLFNREIDYFNYSP